VKLNVVLNLEDDQLTYHDSAHALRDSLSRYYGVPEFDGVWTLESGDSGIILGAYSNRLGRWEVTE